MAPQIPCDVELKPCPFCGREDVNLAHFRDEYGDVIEEDSLDHNMPYGAKVECRNCQSHGPEKLFRYTGPDSLFRAKQFAVADWNRRGG